MTVDSLGGCVQKQVDFFSPRNLEPRRLEMMPAARGGARSMVADLEIRIAAFVRFV